MSELWLLSAGAEAEPVLVDTPAPRWQTLEPEQLPHGHDPGSGRGGRDPGAHPLQGHLLPHVGGSLLVRGTLMWAVGSGFADSVEFLLVFSCEGTWEGGLQLNFLQIHGNFLALNNPPSSWLIPVSVISVTLLQVTHSSRDEGHLIQLNLMHLMVCLFQGEGQWL